MTELSNFIKSQINISDNDLETILSKFKELKIKRDKFVLKQGRFATDYYFIKSGGLRIGFENNNSIKTVWVALENEFFTDLASIKNKTPSRYNIQAIEDTILFAVKADAMDQLYKQFPVWQQFGRQILENAFLRAIDGILNFQNMNAEERYLTTMQQTELLQRIPLKDLASFLGITQTSLSRLRKNIR